MFERSRRGENALLVLPYSDATPAHDVREEFVELARSAGAEVVAVIDARITRPNPATFLGTGKVEEINTAAENAGADLILVNRILSPIQERNLEAQLHRRVVDRTGLILDIFAQRARSHEGKLQVELAQLRYISTRLVRGWTHLERQRGGSIGLRGPGETQLEMDRRLLQNRVDQLQRRLAKVEKQRTQMRRARIRSGIAKAALVGYTNAGKSTLFNVLTNADSFAADQLFATLDPTVRRLDLLGSSIALADTVGFVRDLPHELVAAFRSTLSEVREANLLVHIVDAADPQREERIDQVDTVLTEIGAGDIPQLLVMNKIDCLNDARPRHDPAFAMPSGVGTRRERIWIAAQKGWGIDVLRQALVRYLSLQNVTGGLDLPLSAGRLRAQLHELHAVQTETEHENGWHLEIDIPLNEAQRLASQPDGQSLRALLPIVDQEEHVNPRMT